MSTLNLEEPCSPSLGLYCLGARFLGGKSAVKVRGQGEMDSHSCRERGLWMAEPRGEGLVGVRRGRCRVALVQVPAPTLMPLAIRGQVPVLFLAREGSEPPPMPSSCPPLCLCGFLGMRRRRAPALIRSTTN